MRASQFYESYHLTNASDKATGQDIYEFPPSRQSKWGRGHRRSCSCLKRVSNSIAVECIWQFCGAIVTNDVFIRIFAEFARSNVTEQIGAWQSHIQPGEARESLRHRTQGWPTAMGDEVAATITR